MWFRLTFYLRALGLFVVWHPNPASSKSTMFSSNMTDFLKHFSYQFVIILGIDRSILEVIMYFIVYLGIQSGTTHNAYGRFAIYFVCLVPHIHLTQACVLKPRKGFFGFFAYGYVVGSWDNTSLFPK